MNRLSRCRAVLVVFLLLGHACASLPTEDEWLQAVEPFRVFGNTYFVGTSGLSAILVAGDGGHVLLDGGLTDSVPIIDANIRQLGFQITDVRLIVNSHEHFDHAAALAGLQRLSGASVAASPEGALALRQGAPLPHDPQASSARFPAVAEVRTIADGETLQVGPIALTAHFTPGHTPGATTWTWRSCEGERCLDMVYADSLSVVADDGFRFTGDGTSPSIADRFLESLARVEALPCDVLLVPHPFAMNFDDKLRRRQTDPSVNPFVDPGACRSYVAERRQHLEDRVAAERQ